VAIALSVCVEHSDAAQLQLEGFLADPSLWRLDHLRQGHDLSGFAPQLPDRARRSVDDVALELVARADDAARARLKGVSRQLLAAADTAASQCAPNHGDFEEEEDQRTFPLLIRKWAALLDSENLRQETRATGVMITSEVPHEVRSGLDALSQDLRTANEMLPIIARGWDRGMTLRLRQSRWRTCGIASSCSMDSMMPRHPPS